MKHQKTSNICLKIGLILKIVILAQDLQCRNRFPFIGIYSEKILLQNGRICGPTEISSHSFI